MAPRPLETGDAAHLAWGSVRWSMARQMRLVASMTADATGQVPGQYAAVLSGEDVLLTRDQVASFCPPDKRPANLDRHALWVLAGDDTLKVYRRKGQA